MSCLPLRAGPWHPLSNPLSLPSHPLHFYIIIFLGSISSFLIYILLIASLMSLIIPSLGLPVFLFPTIFSSSTSLNNPSPLNTCPIQHIIIANSINPPYLFHSKNAKNEAVANTLSKILHPYSPRVKKISVPGQGDTKMSELQIFF